jgi:hypothetical protein
MLKLYRDADDPFWCREPNIVVDSMKQYEVLCGAAIAVMLDCRFSF